MTDDIYGQEFVRLTDAEFKKFAELIYNESGINMSPQKNILLSNRLRKRLRELNLATYEDYYKYLKMNFSEELSNMLDVVSTNETFFFRHKPHFETLEQVVLPKIAAEKKEKKLTVWSAGCSSGEEPYTIAMVISENKRLFPAWDIQIIATDISTSMLDYAKEGKYPQRRVDPMDKAMIDKYFLYSKKEVEDAMKDSIQWQIMKLYEVHPSIKSMVKFGILNLQKDTFPKNVDIIFCRNVMIYFDKPTKEDLVNRYYQALYSPGYLFIGHSETLFTMSTPFKYERHGSTSLYYRPAEQ